MRAKDVVELGEGGQPRLGELLRSRGGRRSRSWMTDMRVGEEGKTSSMTVLRGVRAVVLIAGGRCSDGLDTRGSRRNWKWPAPLTPGIDWVRPSGGA